MSIICKHGNLNDNVALVKQYFFMAETFLEWLFQEEPYQDGTLIIQMLAETQPLLRHFYL